MLLSARMLDQNSDPIRGHGLNDYATDINAVGICIAERLQFLTGGWWENLSDGTPLFQSLLGQATTMQAVALVLRQRILGSPYVTGIQSMQVVYNPTGRTFTFTASVQTQFGTIFVTNQPQPQSVTPAPVGAPLFDATPGTFDVTPGTFDEVVIS
jgi:hypothetical protein